MAFSFHPKHRKFEFISIGGFLFLMLVLIALLPFPDLFSQLPPWFDRLLNLLSHSAGSPLFLLSTVFFCLIPIVKRYSLKQLFSLYIQFFFLLILSFLLKSSLKVITEVPRPYAYALVEQHLVDSVQDFYALNPIEKSSLIAQIDDKVSPARIEQWRNETNYSFPSGHTIFVAICLLFWGGFLLRNKHYIIASALVTWGLGVGFSRMWLGMHWPTDVLASIFLASLLILCIPTLDIEQSSKK